MSSYKRIELPLEFDELEPHFDAETMELHYETHHKNYEMKLNAAVEGTEVVIKYPNLIDLMKNYQEVDEPSLKIAIREFGGGLINHNFFFNNLKKETKLENSALMTKIIETWESVEKFKEEFKKEVQILFGSGWVWLVKGSSGNLKIIKTFNQDNPWYLGFEVIFGLDLWEHSYYLKFHSNRLKYLDAFWNVLDWNKAMQNYK